MTIVISLSALVLSVITGVAAATMAQSASRLLKFLVAAYVECFRNTPLLIQLFILYYGLPQLGVSLSPFVCGLSALTLYIAAYNVEIFRAGLEAVPKGQHEAANVIFIYRLQ